MSHVLPHPGCKGPAATDEDGVALGQWGPSDDRQTKQKAAPLVRLNARFLLLAGIIAFFAGPVLAQGGTGLSFVLASAQEVTMDRRTYGVDWECSQGKQTAVDDTCATITVPEGGHLSPSGQGWQCLEGYIRVDDICLEVIAPEVRNITVDAFSTLTPSTRP